MSWTRGCLLSLAAILLGQALQINNGFLHDRAIALVLVSLALVVTALWVRPVRRVEDQWRDGAVASILGVGVCIQIAQLLTSPPLLYAPLRHGYDDPLLAVVFPACAVLAAVVAIARTTGVRGAAFAAILAAHLAAGIWVVRTVPDPTIDVVTVQRAAIDALAAGKSPYSITFPNIYGDASRFYGERMATETEVLFGYPYPPIALALSAPGQWLFGDYRYGAVAALAAAALLMASLGWTRHAMLAATMFLTTPRVLFELEQGWTEPFAVLLLALTTARFWRAPRGGGVPTGLMIAVKQYLAIGLLLPPLLPTMPDDGTRRRSLLVALAVAAAVTVPFVLWDPGGFVRSVVLLQFQEPFRHDSLSLPAWLARRGIQLPTIAATLTAAIASIWLARRTLPSTSSGFAAGMALVTLALFVCGKKAFCNYYFFVIGALAVAIAASGRAEEATESKSA